MHLEGLKAFFSIFMLINVYNEVCSAKSLLIFLDSKITYNLNLKLYEEISLLSVKYLRIFLLYLQELKSVIKFNSHSKHFCLCCQAPLSPDFVSGSVYSQLDLAPVPLQERMLSEMEYLCCPGWYPYDN